MRLNHIQMLGLQLRSCGIFQIVVSSHDFARNRISFCNSCSRFLLGLIVMRIEKAAKNNCTFN